MERKRNNELPSEMTQPAGAETIPGLVEFVSAHIWEMGFDEEKIRDIGLAAEEALRNIIRFACPDGAGEITISTSSHSGGAIIVTITDTGKPFNMLLAGTFPETEDFAEAGSMPSTKAMKKAVKNIEYRRDATKNILIFTIPEWTGRKPN
jgi:anti-sigma regulatory factor (Ser/Thr protein kinase)